VNILRFYLRVGSNETGSLNQVFYAFAAPPFAVERPLQSSQEFTLNNHRIERCHVCTCVTHSKCSASNLDPDLRTACDDENISLGLGFGQYPGKADIKFTWFLLRVFGRI
jgi:hypothetical protein